MKRSSPEHGDIQVQEEGQSRDRSSVGGAFFAVLDDFVKMGVIDIRDQGSFDTIREMAVQIMTPKNSPCPPDAPMKPDQLGPHPRNLEVGPPNVKRRLVLDPEDERQEEEEEENLTEPLRLIDARSVGVAVPYDPRESDPIIRAFQATVDALVSDRVTRKQYLLEEIARALVGTGSLEEYREKLESTGYTWSSN